MDLSWFGYLEMKVVGDDKGKFVGRKDVNDDTS